MVEVFGSPDADASLEAEWFAVAGEIMSRRLLVELKAPSISVAGEILGESRKLFAEKESRGGREFDAAGDPDVVEALE